MVIYGILKLLTSFLFSNGDINIKELKGLKVEMVIFYTARVGDKKAASTY